MDYVYKFPVVRGVQAKTEYFIAMVPLKMLERLFWDEIDTVPPEYRAQRKLNISRIPIISNYILENRDNYVFSALAASIDGTYRFVPNEQHDGLGILEVDMDAKFLINDGQHRKAAILEAINEDESLRDETISVVLYADRGLKRSQQMFTDLNKHAVKTSNSISELYDFRDPLAIMTRNVVYSIDFLNKYVDKERDNLGKYSSSFFTLNTFYKANGKVLGKSEYTADAEQFLIEFWQAVAQSIIPWQDMEHKEISKRQLREDYIVTQNVIIQAIGRVGHYLYQHRDLQMKDILQRLQKVDWSRTAQCWYLRIVNHNGRMIANEGAALLACNEIKRVLQLPLTKDEANKEEQFIQLRKGESNGR